MEIVEIDGLTSLRMELTQLSTQATHSIFKVPKSLHDVNKKAYEPEMVTIGPYHHGKVEFKPMEEVKLRYMQTLLDSKREVRLESYFSIIAGLEKKVRDCYAEPISFNAADFIKMLVLDGCFIIEVIGAGCTSHEHTTYIPYRLRNSLHRDLILLENQIPFFVLCKLFDLIVGAGKHLILMERVLDIFDKNVFSGGTLRRSKEVKHILDLIQANWNPPALCINPTTEQLQDSSEQLKEPSALSIPTAERLKESNVRFKKYQWHNAFIKIGCMKLIDNKMPLYQGDVAFKEPDGVILMPTLTIEDSTESLLRNLIAYEQYFPRNKPTPVTDFALLLDCLINTAKDVQILSKSGIIKNMLGSDRAVADFVNRLTYKIVYYSDNFMYRDLFNRINSHHEKRWNANVAVPCNRALAEFRRDYFKSPWSFFSVVAASVLLLLTVTGTVFTALQYFQHP